jgi:hypothetical protein
MTSAPILIAVAAGSFLLGVAAAAIFVWVILEAVEDAIND